MASQKNISTEQKVNIIFSYLFDDDKAVEEEFFWNEFKKEEIQEIDNIRQEESIPFEKIINA